MFSHAYDLLFAFLVGDVHQHSFVIIIKHLKPQQNLKANSYATSTQKYCSGPKNKTAKLHRKQLRQRGPPSVALDCLAVPHLPVPCHYDGLRRLAVLRFHVFGGGHGSLLRPCRVLPAVQDHLSGF